MGVIIIKNVPKKFGSEDLQGNLSELVGLEIGYMGMSGSEGDMSYLVSLENFLTALKLVFPERFSDYEEACRRRVKKAREMNGRADTMEHIVSPADAYFVSGRCPFNISIPQEVCEEKWKEKACK